MLLFAISAFTEPFLSDIRRHTSQTAPCSDGTQTSNPRLVAVEDELKAVRVEMAEHQKSLESMRSELLEALKPAKTQAVLAIKLLLVCPQLHAGMSHSCGPSQAF